MTAIVLDQVDEKKRRLLLIATTGAAGIATLGVAAPFVASWFPSARALAAGAPVEYDLSHIEPGQQITVEWRGKPVWILKRTQEMLDQLPKHDALLSDPESNEDQQPIYIKGPTRSIKPEIFVAVGVCTHLGCSPQLKSAEAKAEMGGDWAGGFYCPCHGSKFDLAGRVFRGAPAPVNLKVPPYEFVSDTTLVIGEDKEKKGA